MPDARSPCRSQLFSSQLSAATYQPATRRGKDIESVSASRDLKIEGERYRQSGKNAARG